MKRSITAFIGVFVFFALVTSGFAQGASSTDTSSPSAATPSPSAPAPSSPTPSNEPTKPSGDMKADQRSGDTSARSDRRDEGSALPRTAVVERTTIFGLSSTAAIIAGAALLLVVILAIVALGRGGSDVYIDRDRRI